MTGIRKSYLALFLFFLFVGLTASGASPSSDVLIKRLTTGKSVQKIRALSDTNDEEEDDYTHYPVILEIDDIEEAQKILSDLNAVVYHSRGSLYLTSVPVEKIGDIPGNSGILNYHLSMPATAQLDVARSLTGVDRVHSEKQIVSRVGNRDNNVVTGICDIGFDPRHPAFRDCLKQWVIYDELHGTRECYTGYDDITANGPATDDVEDTHATHVGNILAGYSENAPYYGVAPNTDFVATVSRLSDVGLCSGIEDIIAYAQDQGKPAVVNLSVGSYTGPHDGTDLVGRYLSALAQEAIIVFSAGNNGQLRVAKTFDLDNYPDCAGTGWCDTGWLGFGVTGRTDAWSRDDKPFEVRLIISDGVEGKLIYISDWINADSDSGEYHYVMDDFPEFTHGDIWVTWGLEKANNRYCVSFDYDYESTEKCGENKWARYFVGFNVRKKVDDTRVFIYADGINSMLQFSGLIGAEGGNSDGSINNLACGPDIISVGAWGSRTLVPDTKEGTVDWGVNLNAVTEWTSWGTTVDGRKLPHFCAPGYAVVSAMSRPYSEMAEASGTRENVSFDKDGEIYFGKSGTSMSSPFAAGIFALWLHVNPYLGVHDIIDIASTTARKDMVNMDNPRWGAGAIDAYAGLKEVERRAGVSDVLVDGALRPLVAKVDGTIQVTWPGVHSPTVEIFNLAGEKVSNKGLDANSVYIVKISNADSGESFVFKTR